jgi:hypothetical protein
MAKHAGAYWFGSPNYGVFTWDDKLPGAQVSILRTSALNPIKVFSMILIMERKNMILCTCQKHFV